MIKDVTAMTDMETKDTYGGGYSVMSTENKLLVRDTLSHIEWTYMGPDNWACPYCQNDRVDGHGKDCNIARSLVILRAGGTEK